MSPVLTVRNLSLRFGGLVAVADMSFDVIEGEVLSLIGPNGAGKTSAFNAITGYIPASGGDIAYRGHKLLGLKPILSRFSISWVRGRSRITTRSP